MATAAPERSRPPSLMPEWDGINFAEGTRKRQLHSANFGKICIGSATEPERKGGSLPQNPSFLCNVD